MSPKVFALIIPSNFSIWEPHHNERVVIQPNKFMNFGVFQGHLKEHKTNSINYNEAMSNVDAHLWQGATKAKLESMYSNDLLDLVEVPKGVKPIRCKWVYKRMRVVDGKVETCNIRLVVNVYKQKPSFKYEETFSLMVMLKLSKYSYSLWHISIMRYCKWMSRKHSWTTILMTSTWCNQIVVGILDLCTIEPIPIFLKWFLRLKY